MKSKELKIYNLPEDSQVIAQIDAKPNFLFTITILMGLFSFMMNVPSAYGVILILFSLYGLTYMPRVVLMEFFSEYLVI